MNIPTSKLTLGQSLLTARERLFDLMHARSKQECNHHSWSMDSAGASTAALRQSTNLHSLSISHVIATKAMAMRVGGLG